MENAPVDRPNFLIIMTDEHNPRVSSPHGHPFIRTPNLQRLADRGVVFENGYCNSPLCVPSRASFMTGKHLYRIGVWDNDTSLSSNEPSWAHRLNLAGYDTALSGKMHFIGEDQLHGFQRRLVSDIHGKLMRTLLDWNTKEGWATPGHRGRLKEAGPGDYLDQQYDDCVTARSIDYLAEPERKERPWALCVGLITPHFPLIVRRRYWDLYYPRHADLPNIPPGHLERLHPQNQRLREYFGLADATDEETRRGRAAYYGLITFADERIGFVLDALERNGLDENTVVVYVSDHGEMMGEHGMWWKCSFYEASSRVPILVSWPRRFAPGRRTAITSLVDVTRTVLDLAGCEVDEADLDGRGLTGLLDGREADGGGVAFSEYEAHGTDRPARMVRRGRFKLNYHHNEAPELFDLVADPDEFTDLEWERAIDKLSEVVATGQVRAFTGNEYIQDLTAGNIVACEAWSGDVIAAQFDNPDIKFVVPEEGLSRWSDNMLVPNKSEHEANAEKWIDYYYEPEVAAKLAAYVNYICPVEGARDAMVKIDDSLVDNKLIFPSEEDLKDTFDFMVLDDKQSQKYEGEWSDVTGG
jgi:choline-sulfatase